MDRNIFESVLDSMSDGVVVADANGKFLVFNPAAERIVGVGFTDAGPDEWTKAYGCYLPDKETPYPPGDLPLARAMRGEQVDDVEVFIRNARKPEGVWLSVNARPLLDETGAVRGGVVVLREISDRKRAEEALRASQQRTRDIIDSAHEAFVAMNAGGLITDWNKQAEATFGWTRDEAIGRRLSETVIPSRFREAHERGLQHFLATGEGPVLGRRLELIALHRDGHEFPVELTITAHRGASDCNFYAFTHDIAERKQAEEALRNSEALYSSLVETAPWCVFRKDTEGRFVFGNRALCKSLGKPLHEILGKTDFDFFPVALAEKYRRDDQRVMQSREVLEDVEAHRSAEGEPTFVQVVKSPVLDFRGEVIGVQGIFWDVTDRKRAERKLKEMAAELARSNRDLEEFAYVASHDLQEPLRMVSSYCQLLARRYKGKLDANADEFIGFAVDGATRMQNLINDLLNYSRVGRKGRPFESVDCNEVFDAAVRNLDMQIVTSEADVTRGNLPTVMGDRTQLVQLFQNLIGNAIKFRGERTPVVHVAAERKDGEWRFLCRDNGIGIDPKHRERVFQIFQRLHAREEYPGTGIGLAVCKRIVTRHKGRIWVESEPGRGATFYFTFPFVESTADVH